MNPVSFLFKYPDEKYTRDKTAYMRKPGNVSARVGAEQSIQNIDEKPKSQHDERRDADDPHKDEEKPEKDMDFCPRKSKDISP